jgi:hypothetical protein
MLAGLEILMVGILVVLAVLCLLWASCAAVGFGFRTIEARRKAAEISRQHAAANAASTQTAPAAPAAPAGIPPHHLAVIAAATASVMDRPHRILRVRAPVVPASEWGNQARLQTFNSHRRQGDWGHSLPALNTVQSQAR